MIVDCKICKEQITNPLSPDCLGEAIGQWLAQQAPERVSELQELTESYATSEGIRCIVTKRRFCVCTHCYSKDVFNWLEDGRLQLQYLQYFDFITA